MLFVHRSLLYYVSCCFYSLLNFTVILRLLR